jgi:hypothetical protein
MPIGNGAETLRLIPEQEWVTDPDLFAMMTTKQVSTPGTYVSAAGDDGVAINQALPKAGILARMKLQFIGSAVVSTAAATSSIDWPYGLLDRFLLNVNGSTDLWACDGCDLAALRFIRHPAYTELLDVFPGTVGGGDSIGVATHPLHLTWDVPVAMDPTSLIGSIFLQSQTANVGWSATRATKARLFSANPANVAISGNWKVSEVYYSVPFDAAGKMVLPDLSRLHTFISNDVQFAGTGEQKAPLIRSAGGMYRLLLSALSSSTNRLTADPAAATTKLIDKLRLEYGGNQRPLVYDPAAVLLAENQEYYGGLPPYDRHVFDFVRENAPRDVVNLLGVTELNAVVDVNTGVTVTAGKIRAVEETLF